MFEKCYKPHQASLLFKLINIPSVYYLLFNINYL